MTHTSRNLGLLGSLLCASLICVGCKSDEVSSPVATPPTILEADPASARPVRLDEKPEEPEVAIDAHCEMISRDPEMSGQVRVDEGQVLVERPAYFEAGTSNIPVSAYGLLNEIAYQICKTPEIRMLEIGVHTDSMGSATFNLRMSQERADALLEYLSDFIEPERLRAKGYGESQPIAEGSTPDAHAKNRRVEFAIQLQ